MIPDHTPGLISVEEPDGKHLLYTLVVMGKHRVYHIGITRQIDQVEQRMVCPVGIPQGEYGIVGKSVCLVKIGIVSPVGTVYILINKGMDRGVINGCIEDFELLLCTCYFEFT